MNLLVGSELAPARPPTLQNVFGANSFGLNSLAVLLLFLFATTVFAENGLPAPLQKVEIKQKLNHQIPLDLEFTDETGRPVQLKEYFGKKPVILTLVYYECPMLCTYVLNGLVSSMRVLKFDVGKEFDVLTVSFNPRETTALAAAKKQNYLAEYRREGAEKGWHFLTGKEASIRALTDAAGFYYEYDSENSQYAHASAIMVLTPEGKLSRYFYGIEYPPKDLRLALVEASDNKIGSFVDQVLLYCFHYDPATGKYSAYVMNLIRAGGILTVVALGAFILIQRRKERNHV